MLVLSLLLSACAPDCGVTSNLPGFTPVCEQAVLALYPEESRLVVLGMEGGAMVAYLPAPLVEGPYGGTTGRPLDVIVDAGDRQFTAGVPEAELTISGLGPERAGAALTVLFDEGWIHGSLLVDVEHRQ